jgi:uncharacterized repeat protein (TIGR03803 family)
MDAYGNLYGTTQFGGNVNKPKCADGGYVGCGAIFELDNTGKERVLYNFNGPDGANPIAPVAMDANGDLYGTTFAGGLLRYCAGNGTYPGCGVVFKLSGGQETVLHRFCSKPDCADGAQPWGGVVLDASGVLYGTTSLGGAYGGGVVFKLVGKKETVLHSFSGIPDGAYPEDGLLMDASGNLYGTTTSGGDVHCDYPYACGTVFEVTGEAESVLYSFKGDPDGDTPVAGLSTDAKGNLYGTTWIGGIYRVEGTVFELSHNGKEHVVYNFKGEDGDGDRPRAGVIRDAEGNLYGTTLEGGDSSVGIVFKITKDGEEKVLHQFCSFKNCDDGAYATDLIMDAQGNLYGAASGGGAHKNGVIFKITP